MQILAQILVHIFIQTLAQIFRLEHNADPARTRMA